ncbi:hypothetical protein AR457_41770 (plasmid) [Streptomyces agglomeratus]|uniref:hypothetical protein n=1 Tax=Streptomyces agglomeratus TaxID=285458 RepID=UPI000854E799|nr:hypothetical protein [Streptomyces agglomeratus]OEJ20803.1 hypothetical protein AR457_41770 [Streptomyces agglomeratus]
MRKRSGRPPRFAAVPNETVDDANNLDLEALGLLTVVLRHRDGYDITLPEIAEKYGYGRDGLAGAWGMLQVARYVIKVKIQWAGDNQFSTEVVVYDTPATDDEIRELLASIAEEEDVRTVKLEPPTKTARERAARHLAKVQAKRKKQERRKLDFDVPGQSTGETGRSRARRDGGEDQGSAAAAPAPRAAARAQTPPTAQAAAAKPQRAKPGKPPPRKGGKAQVRMSREQAAAVATVEAAWPAELAALLPKYRPDVLRDAILDALDGGRTADQLAARVRRRWTTHGYAADLLPGGKGIISAVGVAIGLVRPSTDCPDPMCEDGVTLHVGDACPKCEQRRLNRKADRRQGRVPGQRRDLGPAAEWWTCEAPDCAKPGKGPAPEDGLCGTCREEMQRATANLAAEAAAAEAEYERRADAKAWETLLEHAYSEHELREEARAAAERERRQRAEAEESKRLREELLRQHPELAQYAQG